MKTRLLKDLLKEQGRTQTWLVLALKDKGYERTRSVFNLYCNGHDRPRDRYVLDLIAQLLNIEPEKVYECFEPYK